MKALEVLAGLFMSHYAAPGTAIDHVSIDGAMAAIKWSQRGVQMSGVGGGTWVGDNCGVLKVPLATLVEHDMPEPGLIAAAPDLFAALVEAEAFVAGFEDDELQDGINARLAVIRAALAKARGSAA